MFQGLHLTNWQVGAIDRLVRNPKLTIDQRHRINQVLYRSYEKWAVKRAYDFRRLHRNKCRNIDFQDLVQASKFGLYQSVLRYNGRYAFIPYSHFFVNGELLKTVTQHYSTSIVPRKIRVQNKSHFTPQQMAKYANDLERSLVQYTNSWLFDDIYYGIGNTAFDKNVDSETWRKKWSLFSDLDVSTRRIVMLKYDYDFNKRHTNKEVAEMMGCSEEKVRLSILKAMMKLRLGNDVNGTI